MANRIRLAPPRELEKILTSAPMRAAVKDAAEKIAQGVRDQNIKVGDHDGGPHEVDLPVAVTTTTTTDMRVNRAKANVTITHPAGQAVQAKHGALTKAAAQAGLKVKSRKS